MSRPRLPTKILRLLSRLRGLTALAQQYAPDCMGLAGVLCIVHGVALVSPAAAWIVGGLAAIGAALLVARYGGIPA